MFHTQDEVHAQLVLIGIDLVVVGQHPIEQGFPAGCFILSVDGIGLTG